MTMLQDHYADARPLIICVDDDTSLLRHLVRLIDRSFGDAYEVLSFSSGVGAVTQAKMWKEEGRHLALVVSDLRMPDLGGDEMLVLLHQVFPHAIKILLTGISTINDSILNAINHAELYRYIMKPWVEEDLILTVGQALEKFRLLARLQQKIDVQTRELFQKHEQLQRQHKELKEAQTRLVQSEKIAALGILLAGVAHEIKNPAQFAHVGALNLQRRLQQLYDFLLEMAGEDAAPELLVLLEEKFLPLFQNMDAIKDGTDRIQLLAGNLHAFSRLSDNDKKKRTQLAEGLRSTLALVEANFRENVQFLIEDSYNPQVHASSARMNQVFMNVIVNACQSIVERVQSEGRQEPGSLKIWTFHVEENDEFPERLGIAFEDTGCGIPIEHQSKIFEPFFSTKPVGQGTGLGLSITWNIIEEHGGTIEIASTVGTGTRLTVFLPLGGVAEEESEEEG